MSAEQEEIIQGIASAAAFLAGGYTEATAPATRPALAPATRPATQESSPLSPVDEELLALGPVGGVGDECGITHS